MEGKTHMPIGIAVATALIPAATLPSLIAGIGTAAIGGVLSDIDAGQSGPHRKAAIIFGVSAAIIAALALIEWQYHLGILELIRRYTSSSRMITGIIVLATVCVFGMHQPHRGIMHSIIALVALTMCVYIILPPVAPYFGIAFASHIVVDLLNRRGVQLLWPLPKRFCFRLCRSNGLVNRILCLASTASLVCIIALRVYLINK